MNSRASRALLLAGMALVPVLPGRAAAQDARDSERYVSVLERMHPGLHEMLLRLERAHGVLFGALAKEGERVRSSGEDEPTFEFEFEMVDRLSRLVQEEGTAEAEAVEAADGYAVLGAKAAAVIAHGNAFHREVLGILSDPDLTAFQDRRAAVQGAVERYKSRPEVALPSAPKDMDILYDHPHALDFRGGYADLDGLIWAGHWLKLAATEPLTDLQGAERAAGLDTVATRYFAKLSYGEPPEFFPSELPLAPAIAPGIIFMSPEAAIIWDNLTMLQEVLADILASPDAEDVRAELDGAVAFFMDPTTGMTDQGEWEIMALRHGIFFQGGYPLGVMTESELNVGGHAAHLRGGGPVIIPGMPG
jgi:hypothetical protein